MANDVVRLVEPLISIVVPAFNEEEFIGSSLDSLLNQTYSNIELILVDDRSSDSTVEVARSKICDSRDIIITNATNMGRRFSSNRGAMHADGEYIIFHDADDISTPERIEKQVQFLEENPDVGVVGGAYYYINPERGQAELKIRPTDDEQIRQQMGRECMINTGTAMFRREALFGSGLFCSAKVEGYELIINIGKDWKLANLEEPVYLYRINKNSRSQQGELYKKAIIAYRSYQAIQAFDLPYWYLPLQLGWLVYMNVPPSLQKVVRRTFSPTEERDLTQEERQEIEEMLSFYDS